MRTRIHFPSPGWFAADSGVRVTLDGEVFYDGSFVSGFAKEIELAPGPHTLEAKVSLAFARGRRWKLDVPETESERCLDVRLGYSRAWGTFDEKLDVRVVDAFAPLAPLATAEGDDEAQKVLDAEHAARPIRATWALLATLAVVYLAELALGVDGAGGASPSLDTLVAMGGLTHAGVGAGQWYRVLSCTFLHVDPVHLVFNGFALAMVGVVIERLVGWRWLLAIYFVGGLGGSAMSLLVTDPSLVSVGASGAIMGLFGAGLFVAQTLPMRVRAHTQFMLLRVLVPSLIPMFQRHGEHVDFGAHLGGALVGAILGAVLLVMLRAAAKRGESIEKAPLATGAAASFVVLSVVAFAAVGGIAYPEARALAGTFIPDAEIAADGELTREQVAGWMARYPDDPRVHVFAASFAYDDELWELFDAEVTRGRALLAEHGDAFQAALSEAILTQLGALEAEGAVRRQLLPNRDLPSGIADPAWAAHLGEWLRLFPNDPRVREQAAWSALDRNAPGEAEEHARAGLESITRFDELFPDGNASLAGLHATRAIALTRLGRTEEAAPLARALCAGSDGQEAQGFASQMGLCAAQ